MTAFRTQCPSTKFFPEHHECYVNILKELYANVVFSIGTTMFQRIVERMHDGKLAALASPTMIIMVGCSAKEKASGVNWRFSLQTCVSRNVGCEGL